MKNKLFKGSLQTIILQMLKDQPKMYGYQMTQKAKLMTNDELVITEGALYPTLHKMEEDDILTASIEVVNGRARKYYSITEKGISILDEKLDELKIFMENMQNIIQLKPIL